MVGIAAKAKEISSALGEEKGALLLRLAAAKIIAKRGVKEVEDFGFEKGNALGKKEVGMLSPSGNEPPSYLLALALFTDANVCFANGKRQGMEASKERYSLEMVVAPKNSSVEVLVEDSAKSEGVVARAIIVEKGASANVCSIQARSVGADLKVGTVANLKEGASLNLVGCSLVGKESDYEQMIVQDGKGSKCAHCEIGLLGKGQKLTHKSRHTHDAKDTFSRTAFCHAGAGDSIAQIDGQVTVEKKAPGADTHFVAKSLLLSRDAVVKSTPMLTVKNSDVKAGHGAAMEPVSADELFYLGARGIDEQEGKRMVLSGFLMQPALLFGTPDWIAAKMRTEIEKKANLVFGEEKDG